MSKEKEDQAKDPAPVEDILLSVTEMALIKSAMEEKIRKWEGYEREELSKDGVKDNAAICHELVKQYKGIIEKILKVGRVESPEIEF